MKAVVLALVQSLMPQGVAGLVPAQPRTAPRRRR